MKSTILAGLFTVACVCGAAGAADKEALRTLLEKDYKDLLARERNSILIREAARLIDTSDQRSNLWNYRKTIDILRTTRSKAGIPLIMAAMLQPSKFSWTATKDFADTLTILTGKDIPVDGRGSAKEQEMVDLVQDLVSNWWTPNRDKISTNQASFTQEQIETVVSRLIPLAERAMRSDRGEVDTSYKVSQVLSYRVFHRSSSDDPGWKAEDLSANMVPAMLKLVGLEVRGKNASKPTGPGGKAPAQESPPMLYEIIPMLGQLRKDRKAPDLDKIAADTSQPDACRLTCLFAMCAAGEKMPTDPLVLIGQGQPRQSIRLAAIIALPYSFDKAGAAKAAMAAMTDENAEIVAAGAYALRGLPEPKAVGLLKGVIDKMEPSDAVLPALMALGEIKTAASADALADFMEAAQQDAAKARHILRAMMAFESVTDRRVMSAGARSEEQRLAQAAEVVKWWREQKGRLPGAGQPGRPRPGR